jgi:hypothetical protein
MNRRSLLLVSAALALVATTSTDVGAALKTSAYAAGNYEFSLDGVGSSFVTSLEGGTMVSDAVLEGGQRGIFVKKKPGMPRFEPLVVAVNAGSLPKPWYDFLNSALEGKDRPRPGALSVMDINFNEKQRRTYTNLRLAELSFGRLEAAASRKPLEIELGFVGDGAAETKGGGKVSPTAASSKSKALSPGNFRVTIPGLDTQYVTAVGELNVKLAGGGTPTKGMDALRQGNTARAEIAPFTVKVRDANADTWKSWHQSFVVQGRSSDAEEKTMTIELLSQNLADVLVRIRLEGVGIVALQPAPVEAGREGVVNEVQATLYAESLRFEPVAGTPAK